MELRGTPMRQFLRRFRAAFVHDFARDVWNPRWLRGIGPDVRVAVRSLLHTPTVAARAPEHAFAPVHLPGVFRHPHVGRQRRHGLRVVLEDGRQIAVHDAHQARPVARLDRRGIPGRLLCR
jgi:hypothetical protein